MTYVKEDHIYEVQVVIIIVHWSVTVTTKLFAESFTILSAVLGKILNQSRSIAKRLIKFIPLCHGIIAVISCDQWSCDGQVAFVKRRFDPSLFQSQCVSMEKNCLHTMTSCLIHAVHWLATYLYAHLIYVIIIYMHWLLMIVYCLMKAN